MSSTPNYGYNKCLDVFDRVDLDLKRVEDKVDQAGAALAEQSGQVLSNANNIDCLGGRADKAEADIASRYTKDETDCKLAAKADRCAFEKHLMDPDAHEELFDGKVDKKEGCRLFCEEDERRINEELEKKVDKGTPEIFDLELEDGIIKGNVAVYWKNAFNEVTVTFKVYREGGFTPGSHVVARLPDGFYSTRFPVHGSGFFQNADGAYIAYMPFFIQQNGNIIVYVNSGLQATYASGTISFLAAQ